MKKIRILIADDHPIVREGYKKILMSQPDMDVTGEAGNGQEVLDLIQKRDFDLILLDISMPGRSGLEILKELKSQKPHLPVMILSIYPEEQYAVRAFRDGASGYLTKASTPKELISAIRKVSQGGRYVTEALAEKLTYFLHGDVDKAPHEKLSDREYQVMLLIASGKTVTQAAEELCLSVKTISTYRRHILEKMQFSTNAEITMYAIHIEPGSRHGPGKIAGTTRYGTGGSAQADRRDEALGDGLPLRGGPLPEPGTIVPCGHLRAPEREIPLRERARRPLLGLQPQRAPRDGLHEPRSPR